MLFTQQYCFRALVAIADAWARTAQGQFMDMPKGKLPAIGEYEQIIRLKTAPLFEVACELGVRAAKQDWHVNEAREYGFACGMAFQEYDDLTDLLKAVGQPWEATASGPLPNSMAALQMLLESGASVSEEDCRRSLESLSEISSALDSCGCICGHWWSPTLRPCLRHRLRSPSPEPWR